MILRTILPEQPASDAWLDSLRGMLGIREKRKFIIKQGGETLTLPVTPWKYSIQSGQLNKTYDILDSGEALVFGNRKLYKLKFDCFFPSLHHGYPFIVGDRLEPNACIERIIKFKESKQPVRVILTDTPVNLMMSIQSFDIKEKDGSRDIDYSMTLTEFRELNIPAANNERVIDEDTGLRGRPDVEESRYKDDTPWLLNHSDDIVEVFKRISGGTTGFDLWRSNNNLPLTLPPDILSGDVLIY